MRFEEWQKRMKLKKPFEVISEDQILLLHANDNFYMYVIDKSGSKKLFKTSSTQGVYKYLLDNYCNCSDMVKDLRRINVYYNDKAVKIAMEKGIQLANGKWWVLKDEDTSGILNQTQMFRCINLRWVHYYFGIDIKSANDIKAVISQIASRDPRLPYTKGFTSTLKKKFITPDTYEKFTITKDKQYREQHNIPSLEDISSDFDLIKRMAINSHLGALIGCDRSVEHHNIYSYDINSAYIFHLFHAKFPSANYKRVNPDEYAEADKSKYAFFLKARFTLALKPKYAEKVIIPMPASYEYESEKTRLTDDDKVIYASNMDTWIWHQDLKYIHEFYNVVSFEPFEIYQFELIDLPQDLKYETLELYRAKERKKQLGENYKTEKVLLNRGGYGLWVTKKNDTVPWSELTYRVPADYNVPFQIGSYIVALQRELLLDHMQTIGMDNVVAFHTDSIKTRINCDEYFKRYNQTIDICGDLGHFEREWYAERIYFFNSVRYKADAIVEDKKTGEKKRKLIVKHGGIDENDMHQIFGMSYDDITADTEIEITKPNSEWIDPLTGKLEKETIITTMSKTEDYMVGSELLAI